MYDEFINEKNNTNIRFGSYTDLSLIKVGSDKGAYEYLEGMYAKAVLDAKQVVSKVINKVKNILVVGSTAALQVAGISLAAKEANTNVNVSFLDTTKWGYYPSSYIGNNVSFDGSYRLELESLNKDFINKFDLILISKRFNGNKEAVLDLICNLEQDSYAGYIINLSLNSKYGFENNFYNIIAGTYEYNKYLPNVKEETVGLSLMNKDLSYYSIFKIKNHKLTDIIRKK
jgi:hypothetical protein